MQSETKHKAVNRYPTLSAIGPTTKHASTPEARRDEVMNSGKLDFSQIKL